MNVAITDANIFIDLHSLDILESIFSLDFEFHTTQEVIDELEDDQIEELTRISVAGHIEIHVLTPEELEELQNLDVSPGLSNTDRSIIICTQKVESMVLTGDMKLRHTLQESGIEVHGILWVFDEMISAEIITEENAANLLESLMEINTWLPFTVCRERIDSWRN